MSRSPEKRRLVRPRGQPLVALALLMVSWVGARAALWEAPQLAPAAEQDEHGRSAAKSAGQPGVVPKRNRAPEPAPMPKLAPARAPKPVPSFNAVPPPDPAKAQRSLQVMQEFEAHQQLMLMAREMPLTEP